MSYRLIAIAASDPARVIGEFATYQGALAARGEDVFDQLAANQGWWLRVEHHIVGPGTEGAATVHPFCTELGVDPHREQPPGLDDLADAYAWLASLH